MAEDDIRVKHWLTFCREAGLTSVDSVKYAKTFCDEDVKMKNIPKKLEHQDSMHCVKFLQLLGVKLGHTDLIIEQVQKEIAWQGEPQVDFVKVDDDAVMEEESNSTMVHSKPCRHHAGEKCLNCTFCGKHLNEKSLVRHVRVAHSVLTTPIRKPKRKSCTKESTSSAPSSVPLKSSPTHSLQDLWDDSSDPVPPVTSRTTARKLGEQGTGHSSTKCAPPALDLSHLSGQVDMVDVVPSISTTAIQGIMQATVGVGQNGCTEATALPQTSSAHLFHSSQANLANTQQPSLVSSAFPPQSSLISSAFPPQTSQSSLATQSSSKHFYKETLSSISDPKESERTGEVNPNDCTEVTAHHYQFSQERFAQAPQPSQASYAHLSPPSRARSSSLAQENLAVSVKQSWSNLASSALPTSYTVIECHPPDCVKPLFHLGYSNSNLSSPQSAQPHSLKLVTDGDGGGDNSAPSATLPVIGTAWSCSPSAAPLIFSSGREMRAACRVGPVSQLGQAAGSVHRIRISIMDQALETIQDMLKKRVREGKE